MSRICDLFGMSPKPGLKVGIEFELEGVRSVDLDVFPIVTLLVEDNSLRNDGQEFVTTPCSVEDAVLVHHHIFNGGVKFHPEFDNCSERCSTHVHVNFTDVTTDKVRQFIRLYALVEPFFFRAVNKSRQNNIYCVPLAATNLLFRSQNETMERLTEIWHKYCAFNVKRLSDLGTIEFRHFEATPDTNKFREWLMMIQGLYLYNKENDVDLLLNTRQLSELVYTVTGTPMTLAEITTVLEDTLVNDLLLMVNPTTQLLKARLKEKKPPKAKAPPVEVETNDLPF